MSKKSDALFDVKAPGSGPGPIYQGVCRQIRDLIDSGTIDRDTHAGTIAQARSLAGSIDRVSGHGGTRQATGMQLAALHAQLDALLARLTPSDVSDGDPFEQFLRELNGESSAPHAPE